jgi:hypothetical protein
VTIFIPDKVVFQLELVRRNKDYYTLIKGTVHQENVMIININALKVVATIFIKQTQLDIQGQVDLDMIMVCDFNT